MSDQPLLLTLQINCYFHTNPDTIQKTCLRTFQTFFLQDTRTLSPNCFSENHHTLRRSPPIKPKKLSQSFLQQNTFWKTERSTFDHLHRAKSDLARQTENCHKHPNFRVAPLHSCVLTSLIRDKSHHALRGPVQMRAMWLLCTRALNVPNRTTQIETSMTKLHQQHHGPATQKPETNANSKAHPMDDDWARSPYSHLETTLKLTRDSWQTASSRDDVRCQGSCALEKTQTTLHGNGKTAGLAV